MEKTKRFASEDWNCDCGTNDFELKVEFGSYFGRCLSRSCKGNQWFQLRADQIEILEEFIGQLNPTTTNPNQTKEQLVNTPTTTDLKTVFASLTQSMGHGAQVGGAVEARQLILDIFYGSVGGKDQLPTWLVIVPERVLAVVFSIILFVLANVIWTEMPFGKQVVYACRLCWEADGRDIVQPYAARLRLAIEKVGPLLPKPEETRSES